MLLTKKYSERMLKDNIRRLYLKEILYRKSSFDHWRELRKIRKKGYANVCFIASSLAMWRYQGIYELMARDSRFHAFIILCPLRTFSAEQKLENVSDLKKFFDSKGIEYIDASIWNTIDDYKVIDEINPDILFYTQPYDQLYGNRLDYVYFKEKLLCYAPYSAGSISSVTTLNLKFHGIAWKLFYDTDVSLRDAQRMSLNKGKNAVVVGETTADAFLHSDYKDVWKPQPVKKKRIIWAPHFTIESSQILHRGSFLWLWEDMLAIAEEYSDKVQIAFKPHPRLKSVLDNFPGWGRERADEYYHRWSKLPNTQYENGFFVDLFMTSDAMIHDSGSFMVEYHYSGNPVLFTSRCLEETYQVHNDLGKAALDCHYITDSVEGVRNFIDYVVLDGVDEMRTKREAFFNKYLLPPNNKTTAENIYDNIVNDIWT